MQVFIRYEPVFFNTCVLSIDLLIFIFFVFQIYAVSITIRIVVSGSLDFSNNR